MHKTLLDRSIVPSFVVPNQFDFQKVNSFTLSNGIHIHSLEAGSQPVIKLEFSFVAGTSIDEGSFESYFCSKLLDQGTKKKSNEDIAEFIAFRGAHLEIISGNEKIIIVVFSLKKHLQSVCELVFEILNESQFEQTNLDRVKTIEFQNLEVKETKTSHIASKRFVSSLFPNHYYGESLATDLIDPIQLEGVKNFYENYLVGAKFDLFVSGAVDDTCIKVIDTIFGSHVVNENQPNNKVLSESVLGYQKIDKAGALQASIRYGFTTIDKTHEDYPLLSITNEIFGGYFGSRLMTNIREEKGYTYGIGSHIVQLRNASYLQIATDVKAENADDTLAEIQIEIDRMCQDRVSNEELIKVRNYIVGNFANSLNTPFELMDKFRSVHLVGLDYSFYNRYFDALKVATPEDILMTSQKYLSQDALKVVCG
jgi:zinc protease